MTANNTALSAFNDLRKQMETMLNAQLHEIYTLANEEKQTILISNIRCDAQHYFILGLMDRAEYDDLNVAAQKAKHMQISVQFPDGIEVVSHEGTISTKQDLYNAIRNTLGKYISSLIGKVCDAYDSHKDDADFISGIMRLSIPRVTLLAEMLGLISAEENAQAIQQSNAYIDAKKAEPITFAPINE